MKAVPRPSSACGAGGLALCAAFATAALGAPVDQAVERARIKKERAQAEAVFNEQAQACLSRFLVTPCTDDAKRARREALANLRQQENLLDDEQRKQRAAERAQGLADKASQKRHDIALPPGAAASAQPEGVGASSPSPARPAPRPVNALTPEQAEESARQRAAAQAGEAAEASRRAQAQRQKLEAATRHRAEVEKRNAEQARSAKPASPGLPSPAASAP